MNERKTPWKNTNQSIESYLISILVVVFVHYVLHWDIIENRFHVSSDFDLSVDVDHDKLWSIDCVLVIELDIHRVYWVHHRDELESIKINQYDREKKGSDILLHFDFEAFVEQNPLSYQSWENDLQGKTIWLDQWWFQVILLSWLDMIHCKWTTTIDSVGLLEDSWIPHWLRLKNRKYFRWILIFRIWVQKFYFNVESGQF